MYKSDLDTSYINDGKKVPITTLFLHTDWNQTELYKLYRQCQDKPDFKEFCISNYGRRCFNEELILDPNELE